jgi:hypothetical protein
VFDHIRSEDISFHVKIVGWLTVISNAIFLVIGAFLLFLLVGIGAASGDSEAFGVLSVVGTALGGFLALLGLPGVIAGIGLLNRAGWGRILALIIAALGLLNFPVGTALGAYTFWVLLQASADSYFSGPRFSHQPASQPSVVEPSLGHDDTVIEP